MSSVSTAMLVAAATVQRGYGRVELAQQAQLARACLERCGAGGRWLLWLVDRALGRACLSALEALALPGLRGHYAWRKRRIVHWAERACADGATQAVLIGSGYDGLGWSLAQRYPALRVFELDRADSVAIKREALRQLRADTSRLRLLGADLERDDALGTLHADPAFDPGRPTLCVAEGVLMYLQPARAQQLLRALAQRLPRTVLVATVMELRCGRPRFRRERPWVRAWLQRRGEPFRWGCERDALGAWLGACGWTLHALAEPGDPDDPDPSPGEWLFLAHCAAAAPPR
ncbi:class I SAM-dependent methyltransferase [Lysobacter antibioticus]|uniref:S-adenosyl-L-methionine-dependent methyltransferase n=1 Tax=Lysobacter antibioticus TaxID=84531 RepID=A0A0S2FGI1_LYSAN|nr:class I SAM-dependent methyltransferase [Lysobacter antibioticus]ALN82643.1 methyltransferase, TIGR00027 family protein [Lysobacter antibioticus]